jgi:glucan 1,3-beta-glucosidase
MIGQHWKYFVQLCHWASDRRELGLSIWPDIHTAPGSQNGFGTLRVACTFFLVEK